MTQNMASCAASRNEKAEKTVCSLKSRRVKRQMRIFIEVCGIKQEAIAAGMGVENGDLSKWLSDGYPNAMGIHHLPDWTREVGPELEDWIAEQNDGGDDIRTLETQSPLTLAGMIAAQAGREVQQIIQDMQDGWTASQRHDLVVGAHHMRVALDALIAECEGRGRTA